MRFSLHFLFLKFIYSEKATNFCKISTLLLSVCTQDKSKVEISQNFVAFSEYTNFTEIKNFTTGLTCYNQFIKQAQFLRTWIMFMKNRSENFEFHLQNWTVFPQNTLIQTKTFIWHTRLCIKCIFMNIFCSTKDLVFNTKLHYIPQINLVFEGKNPSKVKRQDIQRCT